MVKNLTVNTGDVGLTPGSGRSPGVGNGKPLQFLPGEFHGQRSLVGYNPQDRKELDTAEVTQQFAIHLKLIQHFKSNILQ